MNKKLLEKIKQKTEKVDRTTKTIALISENVKKFEEICEKENLKQQDVWDFLLEDFLNE